MPLKISYAVLKGTVQRELTGLKVVPINRYSFKDVPLDLHLNFFSAPKFKIA
jgi:hypothetical protein